MRALLPALLLVGGCFKLPEQTSFDVKPPVDDPGRALPSDGAEDPPNTYCTVTQPAPPVAPAQLNALPYTVAFRELPTQDQLPRLQGYAAAVTSSGQILVLGGRYSAGLHGFTMSNAPSGGSTTQPAGASLPATCGDMQGSNNFANPNCYLWLLDPTSYTAQWIDLRPLATSNPDLYYPLTATNQQFNVDASTGDLVVIGGYGTDPHREDWKSFGGMGTFDTALSVPVDKLASAIGQGVPASEIASLFSQARDPAFATTGGSLHKMQDGFTYLVVGQRFDGNYMAFDDGGKVSQAYTREIRRFQLKQEPFGIQGAVSALTLEGEDDPLHRRDGNFEVGVDPATGEHRLTVFGGVFKPGQIAAYTHPIWGAVGRQTLTLSQDQSFEQRFNQYETPVVSLYDSRTSTAFATFFGGITGTFAHETAYQSMGRCNVTTGNTGLPGDVDRNDGFPFSADISVVACTAQACNEWVLPEPIAPPLYAPPAPPPQDGLPPDVIACEDYDYAQVTSNYALRGGSGHFLADPRSSVLTNQGVVQIAQLPEDGSAVRVGWVFGGIQAVLPLPRVPNRGTFGSNALYEVQVSRIPSAGIPASTGYPPSHGCTSG